MTPKLTFGALIVLGALISHAEAQTDPAFPTMPAQLVGAGSLYKEGVSDGIKWKAWLHTRGTRMAMVCASVDYEIIEPDTSSLTSPIAVARAYWVANVFTRCNTDPFMRPGYLAARAAFNLP